MTTENTLHAVQVLLDSAVTATDPHVGLAVTCVASAVEQGIQVEGAALGLWRRVCQMPDAEWALEASYALSRLDRDAEVGREANEMLIRDGVSLDQLELAMVVLANPAYVQDLDFARLPRAVDRALGTRISTMALSFLFAASQVQDLPDAWLRDCQARLGGSSDADQRREAAFLQGLRQCISPRWVQSMLADEDSDVRESMVCALLNFGDPAGTLPLLAGRLRFETDIWVLKRLHEAVAELRDRHAPYWREAGVGRHQVN